MKYKMQRKSPQIMKRSLHFVSDSKNICVQFHTLNTQRSALQGLSESYLNTHRCEGGFSPFTGGPFSSLNKRRLRLNRRALKWSI